MRAFSRGSNKTARSSSKESGQVLQTARVTITRRAVLQLTSMINELGWET